MPMCRRLLLGLCLCGSLTATSFAQPSTPPSKALLEDAASYAADNGVKPEEAVRRLRLQGDIGRLEEMLIAQEPGFAGMWLEHEPKYRLVVRFQNPSAEARLQERLAGTSLEGMAVEVRPAAITLAELEERHAAAVQRIRRLGLAVDSDLNIKENRVEIYSESSQAVRAALSSARATLPGGVEIITVPALAKPAVLRGGDGDPGYCTGGFTVRSTYSPGVVGISTAGHCGNVQLFQGMALPFQAEIFYDAADVQWHSACGYTDVSNEFNSGLGYRPCTGTRSRIQQTTGTYVCKWGTATGRTCGYIQSKSYNPSYIPGNGEDSFIRVDGRGVRMTAPGDSGGPWFVDGLAYGITSGTTSDGDGIYMAVNYFDWVGAAVLTSDPGPGCNVAPVASFTWSAGSATASFNAAGSYDPDGSITSYSWNFGDGNTGSGATPTHTYPYEGTFLVTLTVTDNLGKTGQTAQNVVASSDPCGGDPCCGNPCCGTFCCGNPFCIEP